MAEYFTCQVEILNDSVKQFEDLIPNKYSDFYTDTFEDFVIYYFEEVKWGELDFLDSVIDNGIPFTFYADQLDNDFRNIHVRFTEGGSCILQDNLKSDLMLDVEYIVSMTLNTSDEEKLTFLNSVLNEYKDKVITLPWDNQIEYGKLYMARKLIDPTVIPK